jgi:uncharacterized protein
VSEKLKVVIDTQIFLRSLINLKSASMKIRPRNWPGQYVLCVSDEIEVEVIDVLNRPHLRAKFPQITDELVEQTLAEINQANRIKVEVVEPISRDPKDDKFLACAKVAKADYLVSEDNDLLVLKQHHSTQIINVLAFLSVLEQRRDT